MSVDLPLVVRCVGGGGGGLPPPNRFDLNYTIGTLARSVLDVPVSEGGLIPLPPVVLFLQRVTGGSCKPLDTAPPQYVRDIPPG